MKSKKTVMFVDDEEDVRQTVKVILEKNGYKTIVCESGRDCLQKLQKQKPQLVLLDIMMPGMSGWQVCSSIKSNTKTKGIPVIFLSGKTDDLSMSLGLKGADDYIMKPFDPHELIKRVQKYVK